MLVALADLVELIIRYGVELVVGVRRRGLLSDQRVQIVVHVLKSAVNC